MHRPLPRLDVARVLADVPRPGGERPATGIRLAEVARAPSDGDAAALETRRGAAAHPARRVAPPLPAPGPAAALRFLYSFPDVLGKPGIGTPAYHQVEGLV